MNWVALLAKSPFKRHLVSQLGWPRGPLGRSIARTMNRSNLKLSRHTLAGLELKGGETVLELGFGGGVALPLLLQAVGEEGKVIGVDRAPAMLREASFDFVNEIETGQLRLFRSELPLLPAALPFLDAIMAVNVVYFWTEPQACVNALAAALRPGGRLSLGLRPPEAAKASGLDKAGFNTVEPGAVLGWMRAAGLEEARLSPLPEGNYSAQAAMARKPI